MMSHLVSSLRSVFVVLLCNESCQSRYARVGCIGSWQNPYRGGGYPPIGVWGRAV
jgi:hypothetical protein